QPIRRGVRLPRPAIAGATVLSLAAVISVVAVGTLPEPVRSAAVAPVVVPSPRASRAASAAPPPMGRPGRKPGAEPRVTFFGDSVSWTLGTYLPPHPGLTTTVRAVQGCGIAVLPDILITGTAHPHYDYCPAWPAIWRKGLDADDPDVPGT